MTETEQERHVDPYIVELLSEMLHQLSHNLNPASSEVDDAAWMVAKLLPYGQKENLTSSLH